MIRIDFDSGKAIGQLAAKIASVNNYMDAEFKQKAIQKLDENVLPVTPVDTGQLKADTQGVEIEGGIIYGPITDRSKQVLSALENSHGGRHAYFVAACLRARRDLETTVPDDLRRIV